MDEIGSRMGNDLTIFNDFALRFANFFLMDWLVMRLGWRLERVVIDILHWEHSSLW